MKKAHDWVGLEVVMESGDSLGWVKHFSKGSNGAEDSVLLSAAPFRWLPDFITGLFELPAHQILEARSPYLIALTQQVGDILQIEEGLLMRFGLSKIPRIMVADKHYVSPLEPPNGFDGDDFESSPVPRNPFPNPSSPGIELSFDHEETSRYR